MATTKKNSLTLNFSNPIETIGEAVDSAIESIKVKASELFETFSPTSTRQERIAGSKFGSFSMPKFSRKKAMQYVVPVVLVVILAVIVFALIQKITSPSVKGVATTVSTASKTTQINRDFEFPLKDATGKQMGTFKYTIISAEERHQIVVKGQNATSVPGRVFLIVNLKLVNTLNQGLQINTRDYMRISVNNDTSQWFAPDIHNDPVEAQAISTTDTRVGLAINETDKNIKLQIGEISGKKTIIPVDFK